MSAGLSESHQQAICYEIGKTVDVIAYGVAKRVDMLMREQSRAQLSKSPPTIALNERSKIEMEVTKLTIAAIAACRKCVDQAVGGLTLGGIESALAATPASPPVAGERVASTRRIAKSKAKSSRKVK